jgi:signal transduction histidine kinase
MRSARAFRRARLVGTIVKTRSAAPEGQDFVISSLPPSPAQRRFALGVVLVLIAAFVVTAGPLSTVQLARIDAFIPMYAAAMFVSDWITAVLLFAQFAILRSHALLAISSGYLFTALILIPWLLTFPGLFAPGGLLGAGLQSTAWLYFLWHIGFPLFVIAYALLKNADPSKRRWKGARSAAILSSAAAAVAVAVAAVCAATFLVTAGHALLPRLMRDPVSAAGSLHQYVAGCTVLVSAVALMVLWIRRGSVLDLWLMVVLCDYVLEICLLMFPVADRYTLGWYAGRIFGLISASIVLFVLLYEITALYARLRLFNEELEQRVVERTTQLMQASEALREAQAELAHINRVTAMGQLAASITHEVMQPIAAGINGAQAALRWLGAEPPNLQEVREALGYTVNEGNRAIDVIGRVRALIRKAPPRKDTFGINEAIVEVITLTHGEAVKNGVSVQTQLAEGLPRIQGDRVQLQQVILNLILNAVQAMSGVSERSRELLISTEREASGGLLVTVQDSGPGLSPESFDRLFDAFYTTKASGMGIGLSICRSIVEAHGGQIWASRDVGRGATVQFTIPLSSAPQGAWHLTSV